MKTSYSITALSLFLSVSSSLGEAKCFGREEVATKLDFFNSVVTTNTLQDGGIIKYEDIGFVRDKKVDLVVSVVEGTTYYSDRADVRNGKKGEFGQINIMKKENDNKGQDGTADFNFCFYDHETEELATVDSFRFSFYDIDERNEAEDGIKEKIRFDTNQVTDFILYPNEQESEVILSCEDGTTAVPCADGVRTVFHSSTKGTGGDNPTDPTMLTEQQKKRSVALTFKDTSCFTITFDHYCGVDKCKWYGGGNFLFSGNADEQFIEEGECVTSPPQTSSPTMNPTKEPTASPTKNPTMEPTAKLVENAAEDDDDFFVPPICPDDVKLIKQVGITAFPEFKKSPAVKIISQDKETVTVKLQQTWMESTMIDNIYYEFKEDVFDLKCYEEVDVDLNTTYDTITIQCNVMTPTAYLEICVADKEFLTAEDDGTVPKCCHSTEENIPTVCYSLEINCVTGCAETASRRNLLRGGFFS